MELSINRRHIKLTQDKVDTLVGMLRTHTTNEIADTLGVSVATVSNYRRKERLPPFKPPELTSDEILERAVELYNEGERDVKVMSKKMGVAFSKIMTLLRTNGYKMPNRKSKKAEIAKPLSDPLINEFLFRKAKR